MKLDAHPEVIERDVAAAFIVGLDDAVEDARGRAPHKSGKYAASIQHSAPTATATGYVATIGATVSSARAKELGAYIVPKRAKHLAFDAGQGFRQVDAVRLPARPVIRKTVNNWPKIMTAALRRMVSQ